MAYIDQLQSFGQVTVEEVEDIATNVVSVISNMLEVSSYAQQGAIARSSKRFLQCIYTIQSLLLHAASSADHKLNNKLKIDLGCHVMG